MSVVNKNIAFTDTFRASAWYAPNHLEEEAVKALREVLSEASKERGNLTLRITAEVGA